MIRVVYVENSEPLDGIRSYAELCCAALREHAAPPSPRQRGDRRLGGQAQTGQHKLDPLLDEIAATCLFLVSDAGGFITGQTIHVNGGAGYY